MTQPAAESSKAGTIFGIIILLMIIGGGAKACGVDSGGSEYGAIDRCESYIETLLKSPSSADFDNEDASDNGDGTWAVTGTVDAENSFGASLRKSWTCTARDEGDDSWSIEEGSVVE